MTEETVPSETENNDGPPSVADRLAMSEEDLGNLPEDQQRISVADMQAHELAQAETRAAATTAAETERVASEAQLKARTDERTRVLSNHGSVEKLLRSTDAVDQAAAQAIMRGEVPLDREGSPTMSPEESQQLKTDWLGGHDVAKTDERQGIALQVQQQFLVQNVAEVRAALPDAGIPDTKDGSAWAAIAQDFTGKGGMFAYLVTAGMTSRDADIEKARTEGEAEGHRKALAGLPGRKEIPTGTPASSDGTSIMASTPRELMKLGNG
jgi:hypothetical protein